MTVSALVERHRQARAYAEHLLTTGELAPKLASTLTGVAVGMNGSLPRADIRHVAERAALLLPYYDALWTEPQQAFTFHWENYHHIEEALAQGRGVIIATAHFGPYRWLVPELLRRGLQLSILVDRPFQQTLSREVEQRVRAQYREFSDEQFEIIDSEATTALWQMARALRRGRVIVNLIDGNSGMEGKAAENGSLELPFLDQMIRVRPGMAALAATSKAPIVPVLPFTQDTSSGLFRALPPLPARKAESSAEYRKSTMTRLFELLEGEIRSRPQEWEEWWLLPQWLAGKLSVPCQRQPRQDYTLTRPALVRARLQLPDTSTWVMDDGKNPHLLDLATGTTDESNPCLLSLHRAAEAEALALDWLREEADESAAQAILQRELQSGRVLLNRAHLPVPTL